jgi:hypothetical protein
MEARAPKLADIQTDHYGATKRLTEEMLLVAESDGRTIAQFVKEATDGM